MNLERSKTEIRITYRTTKTIFCITNQFFTLELDSVYCARNFLKMASLFRTSATGIVVTILLLFSVQ